jgi:hypothetical protein
MEEGDELRRKILGQVRAVPRRGGDGSDLGDVEQEDAPCPMREGRGQPLGRV